ncbi:MAG: hypothetical protein ONB17_02960 [candidate division KSB1 bacterium]|nr:hypothetical protein [candidate division KSB1 bacterium]MDZ7295170.1 hypothetical protein [candidate division KSB1 bacterium]MDZ7393714.1 hypothetical protein [candidate division KSB1 bacterium]MDZ7412469.1 hypothetical protein [candidate division KSB1 bacterium]
MRPRRDWLMAVVTVGTIWGMAEVVMEATLSWGGTPARAVVLPTLAVFFLGVQHALTRRVVAPLLAGMCAAFFKFLNVPFFACQIFAVLSIGLIATGALALASGLRLKERWYPIVLGWATWVFFLFFALTMTYVLRYHWWAQGGWPRVVNYVGLQGGIAALLSVGAFWLGRHAGVRIQEGWTHLLAARPAYCLVAVVALMVVAGAVAVAL